LACRRSFRTRSKCRAVRRFRPGRKDRSDKCRNSLSCCYWPRLQSSALHEPAARQTITCIDLSTATEREPSRCHVHLKGRRNDYRCDKRWEFLRHD
jgi:hypothetical protein